MALPLSETSLTCHRPARCSMHMLASPHLPYTTRPSEPFSCVAAKNPLIRSALGPVAPLMTKPAARALSSATARATAAACSAPCAKAKRVTEGQGLLCAVAGACSSRSPLVPHQVPSQSSRSLDLQEYVHFPHAIRVRRTPPARNSLPQRHCIWQFPFLKHP